MDSHDFMDFIANEANFHRVMVGWRELACGCELSYTFKSIVFTGSV